MAELIYIPVQTVVSGGNAIFQSYRLGDPAVKLSPGAGQIQIQPRGSVSRYRIRYRGNIAIPAGGTVEEISVALALNGEVLGNTLAVVTPAAVENYFYVAGEAICDTDCCVTAALRNVSGQDILLRNAELVVEKGGGCGCVTMCCA